MSIFAKRHYESVALAMQKTYPGSRDPGGLLAWNDVRAVMSDTFKADNYKFDRERFLWACIPGRNARARTHHRRGAGSHGSNRCRGCVVDRGG
jgi:hypothetical protein